MAMRSEYNNQLKEGCVAKMPATDAKQQATTSRCNKRVRGMSNTKAGAMAATGKMTLAMMNVPTTLSLAAFA
jgi:hypothetical protein